MDKFIHLTYDFFAFAFPGAAMVISLLLIRHGDGYLYDEMPFIFGQALWQCFLVLIFTGYVAGYVARPIARRLLLEKLSVFLFTEFLPLCRYTLCRKCRSAKRRRNVKIQRGRQLRRFLCRRNVSPQFIRIREHHPKTAQYIEFWDMHITMSHNLALAVLLFICIQVVNYLDSGHCFVSEAFATFLFALSVLSFFTLLQLSLKYAFWWYFDIKYALRLTNNPQLRTPAKSNDHQ